MQSAITNDGTNFGLEHGLRTPNEDLTQKQTNWVEISHRGKFDVFGQDSQYTFAHRESLVRGLEGER